jgi:transposase-like protein
MEKEQEGINKKFQELKPYQQKTVARFLDNFSMLNDLNLVSISSEGMICRKCGTNHFVKNGWSNGVQRYKCKACRSTQFHDANTPLYNLKLKDKWTDFVFIMLDNERSKNSISISEELDISFKTAFRWRHKFLSSLNNVNNIELSEETELDEIYLPFTVKGVLGKEKFDVYIAPNHSDNIESEFRIEEKMMEEESYQSIFMCIHNRKQDFDFIPIKHQKKGVVSEADLTRIMQEIKLSGKTVITDSETSMKSFLNKIGDVNHLTFKSSDIKQGKLEEKIVHNNNINNTMMLLNKWLKDFFGVSTKYIWNYLKWFRFIRKFEIFKMKEMLRFTLSDKNSYPRFKSLFDDYVTFARV